MGPLAARWGLSPDSDTGPSSLLRLSCTSGRKWTVLASLSAGHPSPRPRSRPSNLGCWAVGCCLPAQTETRGEDGGCFRVRCAVCGFSDGGALCSQLQLQPGGGGGGDSRNRKASLLPPPTPDPQLQATFPGTPAGYSPLQRVGHGGASPPLTFGERLCLGRVGRPNQWAAPPQSG